MRSAAIRSTRTLQGSSTLAFAPSSRRQNLPRAACIFCSQRLLPLPARRPTITNRRWASTSTSTSPSASTSNPTPKSKESPIPQTHYDLFPQTLPHGPPPTGPFPIPLRALRTEYLSLQASAHPDLHSGANKARAEGLSALINEAYKTLQDPLRRAQYLLSLRGIEVAEDERARTEDAELLMAVMEAREAIEGAEGEEELGPVREENEGRIEESVRRLEEAFARDDLVLARGEAVRLRYWVNIRDSLDAWERGKPIVLMH